MPPRTRSRDPYADRERPSPFLSVTPYDRTKRNRRGSAPPEDSPTKATFGERHGGHRKSASLMTSRNMMAVRGSEGLESEISSGRTIRPTGRGRETGSARFVGTRDALVEEAEEEEREREAPSARNRQQAKDVAMPLQGGLSANTARKAARRSEPPQLATNRNVRLRKSLLPSDRPTRATRNTKGAMSLEDRVNILSKYSNDLIFSVLRKHEITDGGEESSPTGDHDSIIHTDWRGMEAAKQSIFDVQHVYPFIYLDQVKLPSTTSLSSITSQAPDLVPAVDLANLATFLRIISDPNGAGREILVDSPMSEDNRGKALLKHAWKAFLGVCLPKAQWDTETAIITMIDLATQIFLHGNAFAPTEGMALKELFSESAVARLDHWDEAMPKFGPHLRNVKERASDLWKDYAAERHAILQDLDRDAARAKFPYEYFRDETLALINAMQPEEDALDRVGNSQYARAKGALGEPLADEDDVEDSLPGGLMTERRGGDGELDEDEGESQDSEQEGDHSNDADGQDSAVQRQASSALSGHESLINDGDDGMDLNDDDRPWDLMIVGEVIAHMPAFKVEEQDGEEVQSQGTQSHAGSSAENSQEDEDAEGERAEQNGEEGYFSGAGGNRDESETSSDDGEEEQDQEEEDDDQETGTFAIKKSSQPARKPGQILKANARASSSAAPAHDFRKVQADAEQIAWDEDESENTTTARVKRGRSAQRSMSRQASERGTPKGRSASKALERDDDTGTSTPQQQQPQSFLSTIMRNTVGRLFVGSPTKTPTTPTKKGKERAGDGIIPVLGGGGHFPKETEQVKVAEDGLTKVTVSIEELPILEENTAAEAEDASDQGDAQPMNIDDPLLEMPSEQNEGQIIDQDEPLADIPPAQEDDWQAMDIVTGEDGPDDMDQVGPEAEAQTDDAVAEGEQSAADETGASLEKTPQPARTAPSPGARALPKNLAREPDVRRDAGTPSGSRMTSSPASAGPSSARKRKVREAITAEDEYVEVAEDEEVDELEESEVEVKPRQRGFSSRGNGRGNRPGRQFVRSAGSAFVSRRIDKSDRFLFDSDEVSPLHDTEGNPLCEDEDIPFSVGEANLNTMKAELAASQYRYKSKTKGLKWTENQQLALYRTIQKMPIWRGSAYVNIAYHMLGEPSRRSNRDPVIAFFNQQQMKDKMKQILERRCNHQQPVLGNARFFLKLEHPLKQAYSAELEEAKSNQENGLRVAARTGYRRNRQNNEDRSYGGDNGRGAAEDEDEIDAEGEEEEEEGEEEEEEENNIGSESQGATLGADARPVSGAEPEVEDQEVDPDIEGTATEEEDDDEHHDMESEDGGPPAPTPKGKLKVKGKEPMNKKTKLAAHQARRHPAGVAGTKSTVIPRKRQEQAEEIAPRPRRAAAKRAANAGGGGGSNGGRQTRSRGLTVEASEGAGVSGEDEGSPEV